MGYLLVILLSAMIFTALLIVKAPLMLGYLRFRRWVWHRCIIWKIERNVTKISIQTKKLLSN
jgi:hypothetical protein